MEYKLIKQYPGSPELGYISKTKDSDVLDGHYWMGSWFNPQNFPEYWEEVVEYVKCDSSDFHSELFTKGKIYKVKSYDRLNEYIKVISDKNTSFTVCNIDLTPNRNNITNFLLSNEKEYNTQYRAWEIVSLISSQGRISDEYSNGKVMWSTDDSPRYIDIDTLLEGGTHNIYSIRRKSDGEIFTIGDKIVGTYSVDEHPENKGYTTIDGFQIINNDWLKMKISTGFVNTDRAKDQFLNLKHYVKPFSYTSYDGVEIYIDQEVYFVDTTFNVPTVVTCGFCKNHIEGSLSTDWIVFSSKSKAEDHIIKNRILFVTEDGVGITSGVTVYSVTKGLLLYYGAYNKQLNNDDKHFSTKKLAQEYIDMNKPMYSKQQLIDALHTQLDCIDINVNIFIENI